MYLKYTSNFISIINALHHKKIIAYPTESVFGLGCDPNSEFAVNNLLILKKRSWKKGFILVAANYQQLIPYINDNALNNKQRNTILSSWPGPITWVIPTNSKTPKFLTGHFNSIAVRVSAHPLIQTLCTKYGKPIISTSANFKKQIPCRNIQEVKQKFGDTIPILIGKIGNNLHPSEIRDAISNQKIRIG